MRLVILKETNTVGKDNVFYNDLDLSLCNLPDNLWALQWYDNNTGHIEFNSPMIPNDDIIALPEWATACVNVWQAAQDAYDAEQAAIKAQQAAIDAAQETL